MIILTIVLHKFFSLLPYQIMPLHLFQVSSNSAHLAATVMILQGLLPYNLVVKKWNQLIYLVFGSYY